MIFFPQELQVGIQDDSSWPRLASSKWKRNWQLYRKYFALIRSDLPFSVIAFTKFSFHDCEVVKSYWKKEKLFLILDTQSEEMPFPERYVHITFTGVRKRPLRLPSKKEWWNWEEFHLGGGRSKFCLHILFTDTAVEISADKISLRLSQSHQQFL